MAATRLLRLSRVAAMGRSYRGAVTAARAARRATASAPSMR